MKLAIKGRHSQMRLAAGVLAALKESYPNLIMKVVDSLVE